MEKEKEIAIDSLNIKIGGREISLSVAEAKKLKKALEDLFGKEVVHEHHDHWYYKYYQKPYQPYWGEIWWGGASVDNNKQYISNKSEVLCMSIK